MSTVFLFPALIGGGMLVLLLLLSLVGLGDFDVADGDADAAGHGEVGEALNLLSIRSLSAALAFFGLVGGFVDALGLPFAAALAAGVVAGGAAAVAVAWAVRMMLRLEEDGSLQLERAIGSPATVYLSIPGERSAPGKVHLSLQGRTVECQAVSEHALQTGAAVVVMDVVGSDTVVVAPSTELGGLL